MPKPDEAHLLTEKELKALEHRISQVYKQAADEVSATIKAYFESFRKRDEEMRKQVDAGKITEDYYKQWRLNQIGRGKRFEALRDQLAERYTKANETAIAYVNDLTPGIYSLNRNYAGYTIEQVAGDVGFTIWDEQTVKRLIVEQPDVMPYYPPKRAVKRKIDLAYGKSQITKSVTSSILQGSSIGKMANDLQRRITDMSRVSAIRAARTATTAAQNAGRLDSYHAAQNMGIKMRKEWLATIDGRTRHAHAMLDGQKADVDKPFKVEGHEIRYPGDPQAAPYLVYNCRCTLIAAVDDVDTSSEKRRAIDPKTGESVLIEDMSYSEWAGWKQSTNQVASGSKSDIIEAAPTDVPVVFRRFETGEQVNDFFYYDGDQRGLLALKKSEYGQWERSLSQQQRITIGDYCADGYADINSYWRKYGDWEHINAEKVLQQTKDLDDAISSYHLKENIKVYRAVQPEAFEDYWDDIQKLVGTTYTDPAFMSTSPYKGSTAVNKECIMELDIPAGFGRGAYVNRISGFQDEEYEFLLHRDSKFLVRSVEETEDKLILRMEMIL